MFINLLPVAELYFNKQSTISIDETFKLISFNVLDTNSNKQEVLNYFLEENPDLLVINEYTPQWDKALDTLKKIYSSYQAIPLDGHFGIAVFSKYESRYRQVYYAMNAVPSIEAKFAFNGDSIRLIATHPTPPVTPFDWEARNYQFEEITKERIGSIEENFIIAGDLNISSFSKPFKDLLEITFTRDTRLGYGLQPTWPTGNKLFYITLDHCLVSDQIVVKNRESGPYLGSDHLPIEVVLSLKKRLN
jgi:endonuclease/exonuclease/phosphatase (EEP) superfamily protein YafD